MHCLKVIAAITMLVVVLGLAGACASEIATRDDNLGVTFQETVTQVAVGDPLHFVDVYGGEWSRAAIFPAYTTNERAKEVLGFDFDVEAAPSQDQDRSFVVVFANDARVVKWFSILPSEIGFGDLTQPVTADRLAAVATLRVDSSGDRVLEVSAWQTS